MTANPPTAHRASSATRWLVVVVIGSVGGCAGPSPTDPDFPPPRPLGLNTLLKSDVDSVIELAIRQELLLLRRVLWRMYRDNPGELEKTPGATMFTREQLLFDGVGGDPFIAAGSRRSTIAIDAALGAGFCGDRVFTLVFGLRSMVLDSYGGDRDLYITDTLDPQRMYHAARNMELALVRLSDIAGREGVLTLDPGGYREAAPNESVEHLFGRLVALQDLCAIATAESQQRVIKLILQTVASAVFLPV